MRGSPYGSSQRGASPQFSQVRVRIRSTETLVIYCTQNSCQGLVMDRASTTRGLFGYLISLVQGCL